jgi:hypothetical protein
VRSGAAEGENKWGGYADADDVDLAEEAVQAEMTLAHAGGELEGADDCREDAGEGVGKEDEPLAQEKVAVRAAGVDEEEWVLGVEEDGDAGEGGEGPEERFGERALGPR